MFSKFLFFFSYCEGVSPFLLFDPDSNYVEARSITLWFSWLLCVNYNYLHFKILYMRFILGYTCQAEIVPNEAQIKCCYCCSCFEGWLFFIRSWSVFQILAPVKCFCNDLLSPSARQHVLKVLLLQTEEVPFR